MTENKVRIGDNVKWRGCFGMDAPRSAVVTGLEITDAPRTKYGREVEEASWELVRQNRVLFTLDNGHWAYGEQISKKEK
jgi:hypothetical protein